jgi:hypothetical protein
MGEYDLQQYGAKNLDYFSFTCIEGLCPPARERAQMELLLFLL